MKAVLERCDDFISHPKLGIGKIDPSSFKIEMLYNEVSLQELVLWNVSLTVKFRLDQIVGERLAQFSFFGVHFSFA